MGIGHWALGIGHQEEGRRQKAEGRRQKAEEKKIYTAIFLAIDILRLIKWIYLIEFVVDRIFCCDLSATATADVPNFIVTLLL
ncbi:MAG: hypothetical protein ACMG55_09250 [Microcoleus sp.]